MSDSLRMHFVSSGLLPWMLLLGMLAFGELGWRIGRRIAVRYEHSHSSASSTFVAAIFGLLALLVAFTFSGAANRYDLRRELIVKETSSIGTAYLAVDRLNDADQPPIRGMFREFLDHRIALYQDAGDSAALNKKIEAQSALGLKLWRAAVDVVKKTDAPQRAVAARILLDISAMLDAFDNQRLAMKFHPPAIIWQSLFLLPLIGALLAGYNLGVERKRDWLLNLVFVILMVGALYVILSLEFPRLGHVTLDDFEQELVALRKSM